MTQLLMFLTVTLCSKMRLTHLLIPRVAQTQSNQRGQIKEKKTTVILIT